jgi:RNA polymerase sigma factor (sigma-70 family)
MDDDSRERSVTVDERAGVFEAHRSHLRAVAYRILGSLVEADDAVQEAWLRLNRSDTGEVANFKGWLTTVVARVCLDMLRARKARPEEPAGVRVPESMEMRDDAPDPEAELLMADSVGLALLVVLETLPPPERLAFVLHDMFAVSFEEIAPMVGRTPTAARKLASRARRRIHGTADPPDPDMRRQREIVDAFLAASRGGDFDALLAVLDPDVVFRADAETMPSGKPLELRGASIVAKVASKGRARGTQPAIVDGSVGAVVAPLGRLRMVLRFVVKGGRIVELEAISEPERLRRFDLAVLTP